MSQPRWAFYSLISLLICRKQTNGDRDMRGFIALSLLMASGVAVANEKLVCEYAVGDFSSPPTLLTKGSANVKFDGKSFTVYRPDGSYIVSPPLTEKKDGMIFVDDKTKVFAASQDKSNFAVSDRIKKTTEQWAKCEIDKASALQKKSEDEMRMVESLSGAKAKSFFMKEKHAFTTNCLVWEDVTMITGRYPAMIIAGSVMMGKNPRWDGREYSFTFNGGSMMARFVPSEPRHKFVIQAGDKFYGCGPSEIDHNYE